MRGQNCVWEVCSSVAWYSLVKRADELSFAAGRDGFLVTTEPKGVVFVDR